MDIINKNAGLLSNFEVYQLIRDIKEGKKGYSKPDVHLQDLATIVYELFQYLDRGPCKCQSEAQICLLMRDLEKFQLTKAEKLQLVNLLPKTPVEIQLMIEESEERLSEQDIEMLLASIGKHVNQ